MLVCCVRSLPAHACDCSDSLLRLLDRRALPILFMTHESGSRFQSCSDVQPVELQDSFRRKRSCWIHFVISS
jgi:hypothetical protein